MVTGATSGIGEACALRFAKEGYDVIITGRRDHLLQALAGRIEALGVRAKTLCFDAVSYTHLTLPTILRV